MKRIVKAVVGVALTGTLTAVGVGAQSQLVHAVRVNGSIADGFGNFGYSISLSGDRMLVGAPNHDVNGTDSGAAYVYDRQGDGSWTQSAQLVPNDGAFQDLFGISVALAGDVALVGSSNHDTQVGANAGSAYVFERQVNGTWLQMTRLNLTDAQPSDLFGSAVALNAQGNVAVVGAEKDGDPFLAPAIGSFAVFVKQSPNVWVLTDKKHPADGNSGQLFGNSIALDGGRVIVGSFFDNDLGVGSGSAYVYAISPGGLATFEQKLLAPDGTAGDDFGRGVDVSGDRVLVGAYNDGALAPGSGSAYLFKKTGGSWGLVQKLLPAIGADGDRFGWDVALDGDRALVSAPRVDIQLPSPADVGQVYLFERQGNGTWLEVAIGKAAIPASGGTCGYALDMDGDRVVAGAVQSGSSTGGRAHVFRICNQCTTAYGVGTPGCKGPQNVYLGSAPELGTANFTIMCDNAPQNLTGLLLVGNAADAVGHDTLNVGVLLHVDVFMSTELLALDIVSGSGSSSPFPLGTCVVASGIPNNPILLGVKYHAQAIWAWTNTVCNPTVFDLSSSKGLTLEIIAP